MNKTQIMSQSQTMKARAKKVASTTMKTMTRQQISKVYQVSTKVIMMKSRQVMLSTTSRVVSQETLHNSI